MAQLAKPCCAVENGLCKECPLGLHQLEWGKHSPLNDWGGILSKFVVVTGIR